MKDRFLISDGDKWYERNKEKLTQDADIILDVITANEIKPESTLELGCSNGYRLDSIYSMYNSTCWGVDLSMEAIKEGKRNYPQLKLKVADISAPYGSLKNEHDDNRKFDLVIVNFVLHWIDRDRLYNAIANIDANVKNGGFLIIGDFYDYYRKVPYAHKEGLYTWKMDYSKMFTQSGNYIEFDKVYFDHENRTPYVDGEMNYNTCKVSVLQKRSVYAMD